MNARFVYLYQDAGNPKKWDEIVFLNLRVMSADIVTSMAEPDYRC